MTFLYVGALAVVVMIVVGLMGGAQNRSDDRVRQQRHLELENSGPVVQMKVSVLTRKGEEVFGIGRGATEEEATKDAVQGMTRSIRSTGDSFYKVQSAVRVD